MCRAAENCKLQERVEQIDSRVTKLEDQMHDGFAAVTNAVSVTNAAVDKLASEFGTRMNNIDSRLVEEKVKWGDTTRSIVVWATRTILLGAAAAMGLTAWKMIFGN